LGPCRGDGAIRVVTTESAEAIEAAKQAQKAEEEAKQAKAAMDAQAARLAELEAKLKAAEAAAAKTPEQKAEEARVAAEAKAYAEAKVAAEMKAAAEEKALAEARAAAEAKAAAAAEAEADARERANAEAAEREKMAPIMKKAEEFNRKSKTNWKITDTKDEMSGAKKVFATAQVRIGLSIVESKLACEGESVNASFTVLNATYPISYSRGKNDLSALAGLGCAMRGRAYWVNGRFKLNDKLVDYAYCVSPQYQNVVEALIFSKKNFEDNSYKDAWGMMFEIPTNKGAAVFYLPTSNPSVSRVIEACK